MVKIRLTRLGKKNDPFYRVIAIDSHKKREGEALEVLGHWYPKKDTSDLKKDRIKHWVAQGAQMSDAVKKLLQ